MTRVVGVDLLGRPAAHDIARADETLKQYAKDNKLVLSNRRERQRFDSKTNCEVFSLEYDAHD